MWIQEIKQRPGDNTALDTIFQHDIPNILFANIEQLITFNRQLLDDLQRIATDGSESIVEVIAKTAPFLKVTSRVSYSNRSSRQS